MKGTEEPKVRVARLRASKALWNRISAGQTIVSDQMHKSLAYQMNKPSPMTPEEILVAEKVGLDIHDKYVRE